ncbi:MAG: NAD(P)-dependent oxidoreductase [Desulfobacula sp.]|nr:NAD(P)-dependent oxidoreductase [Desulfobacula sp.]
MNIIVFGGSGFLGSHVCDKLSDAGHIVTIFDIAGSKYLRDDQKMIVGDILNEQKVKQAVKGKDIVFNFAGIADIGDANNRPVDTVKYNILGNTILLEACCDSEVKRYVFASSAYVYSKSGGFYRCSKQACELYIEMFNKNYGLEYTILRYGSLYGPRAGVDNAIFRFVAQALKEKKISYEGSPESLREYIHVEDAALCSLEILKSDYKNQNIILTGHQSITVGNVLKMIAEILGKDIEFVFEKDLATKHYEITPYSFNPRIGKKLTTPFHEDLGQGILRVIEEQYLEKHPDLNKEQGLFLK